MKSELKNPGELLRDLISEKKLSVKAAADKLGVTRAFLFMMIRGAARITPKMAVSIERELGSSAELLLHYQSMYDLIKVRTEAAAKARNQQSEQTNV